MFYYPKFCLFTFLIVKVDGPFPSPSAALFSNWGERGESLANSGYMISGFSGFVSSGLLHGLQVSYQRYETYGTYGTSAWQGTSTGATWVDCGIHPFERTQIVRVKGQTIREQGGFIIPPLEFIARNGKSCKLGDLSAQTSTLSRTPFDISNEGYYLSYLSGAQSNWEGISNNPVINAINFHWKAIPTEDLYSPNEWSFDNPSITQLR